MGDNVHPSELLEFTPATPISKDTLVPLDVIPGNNTEDCKDGAESHEEQTRYPNDLYANLSFMTQRRGSIEYSAYEATQREHRLSFRQALRIYPKAIGWSAIISLAIVMEGYDTALINTLYAFAEFRQNYGSQLRGGQYSISPRWQASLSNGSTTASLVGLLAAGLLIPQFGYRRTMMGALLVLASFIFLSFFAFNIQTLLASQVLCGLPWGVFSILTTTYAAEVVPLNLRVYLTSVVNMCWLLGQITASGVLRALLDWQSSWAYRIPFGLQWVWIVFVFTAVYFAPESPWWLIQQARKEDAERVLTRLTRRDRGFDVDGTIAIMEHTNNVEKQFDANRKTGRLQKDTSYLECFRGTNLRRTEIACMIFVSQNFCGLPIIGYSTYLYRQIGFDERQSFDINIGMTGLGLLGGFIALVIMKRLGRRTMYLWGLGLCLLALTAAGTVGCFPATPVHLWTIAGLLLALIFIFDMTVGPITYCLVAELPSTRLRIKTVVLARMSYNISGVITNILIQRMINPTAWNWQAKSCFFCAITCALSLVYCYFRLPETQGLGFHEIDVLFEKGANARKFATLRKALERNNYYSFHEDLGPGPGQRSLPTLWR